jgi:hypothetical protein
MTALAVAACGPKAPPATPGGVGAVFPNLFQASYRIEANIIRRNGEHIPVVIVHSGQNTRMEMEGEQGHMTMIRNNDTHEAFTIMQMSGRQIVMRVDTSGAQNLLQQDPLQMWANREGVQITRGGQCAAAGEAGTEWSSVRPAEAGGAGITHSACVTGDGIILQAKEGERVTFQTTRIQRGPQDPSQFTLPPGVQVMNLGNAGALLSQLRDSAAKPSSP